ncbi:single-stranded DNA-binding protein [Candidatus Saccharibacteria bacterium]|nr:single-stranded DNA-binding protein [Candidatus Saccharibacteria bacterium]
MAGFCNIVISGNLTRKPELKKTPSGLDVTELNVAVSTYKKGAPDNQQTTFFRASIFGVRAGNAAKFLDKGSSVIVSGQNLVINTYSKQDGSTGASPEFIADNWTFAGRRNEGGESSSFSTPSDEGGFSSGASSGKGKKTSDVAPADIDNTINLDDIPF